MLIRQNTDCSTCTEVVKQLANYTVGFGCRPLHEPDTVRSVVYFREDFADAGERLTGMLAD